MLQEFLIKNKESARRVFGKRELEIILKQLNGITLTQSEKNRLSRAIKPKLQFINEIAQFSGEFELKKNQDNKSVINKAVNLILEDELNNNISSILLFGSFADNTFTKRSDIDICIVFKISLSLEQATKFRIRISSELPKKIDIQVFNILPQKVKRSIAKNHKILYKSGDYDNTEFTIKYLKDDDYFIRMRKIFRVET